MLLDLMDDLNWAQSDAEIKEQTRRQKVSQNTENVRRIIYAVILQQLAAIMKFGTIPMEM